MREKFLIFVSKIMSVIALVSIMLADSDSKLPFYGLCVSVTWLALIVIANTRSDKSDTRKSV